MAYQITMTKPSKTCEKCGDVFYKRENTEYVSVFIKRKFCSKRCSMLGKKMSNEVKIKVSCAKKGSIPWNKGIKNIIQSGENNGNWKGGITPINKLIRESFEARNWRKQVFERDDYTCQDCGVRSGCGKTVILHADHIKQFAHYPELRFELSNGRTLCKDCHRKTPTWGNHKQYAI